MKGQLAYSNNNCVAVLTLTAYFLIIPFTRISAHFPKNWLIFMKYFIVELWSSLDIMLSEEMKL